MGEWSDYTDIDYCKISTIGDVRPVISKNSEVGDGYVNLQWDPISGASKYAIYEVFGDSLKELSISCQASSFRVDNLANYYSHTFMVQSYVSGSWSRYSSDNYESFIYEGGTIKPVNPTSYSDDVNHVVLTWGTVPGAERYTIARQNSDGKFYTYTYTCTSNTYDIYIRGGGAYKFVVQAYIMGNWSYFDSTDLFDVVPKNDINRPKPNADKIDKGTVTLSWPPVNNATKYAIAVKISNGGLYTFTTECISNSYIASDLTGGTRYFLVQAFVNNSWSKYNEGDYLAVNVPSAGSVAIMSSPRTYAQQMANYFHSKGMTFPSNVYSNKGAATIEDFAQICYEEGTVEGVDPAVLFCQAMHETGWLQFGGDVSPEQCNFGGLGATGGGTAGATFPDVRTGLRAQVQHLKAYASVLPFVNIIVDPRFDLVLRGCAPCVTDLNGRWAVPGIGYGEAIIRLMNELSSHLVVGLI